MLREEQARRRPNLIKVLGKADAFDAQIDNYSQKRKLSNAEGIENLIRSYPPPPPYPTTQENLVD